MVSIKPIRFILLRIFHTEYIKVEIKENQIRKTKKGNVLTYLLQTAFCPCPLLRCSRFSLNTKCDVCVWSESNCLIKDLRIYVLRSPGKGALSGSYGNVTLLYNTCEVIF